LRRNTRYSPGLGDLGVLPHVCEAILNHIGGFRAGVAGVYNRATYESEMRDALARWADYVEALVSQALPLPNPEEALPSPSEALAGPLPGVALRPKTLRLVRVEG
jgi:hypothetical protein